MSRFAVSAHVAWRNVDGELVLFDRRDGSYHALNQTGSAIWRDVAEGTAMEIVVDVLARRFGTSAEVIAADVISFIAAAVAKGFLLPTARVR